MTIEFDELHVADGKSDRGRGRRRVVASVAAVMLVAAAGGTGYGIGRGVDRDTSAADDGSIAAGTDDLPAAAATTTPTTGEEPSGTLAPATSRDEVAGEVVDVFARQTEGGDA